MIETVSLWSWRSFCVIIGDRKMNAGSSGDNEIDLQHEFSCDPDNRTAENYTTKQRSATATPSDDISY
jgi:hypothetical protein